ncbi:molybdopterin molybdotransferase MoeA [Carnimonas bestiolae]|uniref:molybdopterin molybdotransferase MoeA n=1 Tax=Carnimonas bestiolae TaxID=3402172 RepID=UPI003EDB7C75
MADMHTLEDARAMLLAEVNALDAEQIAVWEAHGRILAEPIVALSDSPRFDVSAMDGYALRAQDQGKRLAVSQRIAAGQQPIALAANSCARIFTGAPLPAEADCVVMQERVSEHGGFIDAPNALPIGDNVRLRGREVLKGTELLPAGARITPAALGLIASQGIAQVKVRRRPRVVILATGDELVAPGKPLAAGQIHDSNRVMLAALLRDMGADIIATQHVRDSLDETRAALRHAAEHADLVLTSGGVSVGEEDHVKQAVTAEGELSLWRLDIRPGKPLALGRLPRGDGSAAHFIGLAGNPVSSFVGALLLVRPLLGALLKAPALDALPALTARAQFTTHTAARWHYMRVSLDYRDSADGCRAHAYGDQDSSLLRSCVGADALAVIPPNSRVSPGDVIDCLLIPE